MKESGYCKTLYFCCILISRFSYVELENSLYFNLAYFSVSLFCVDKVMVIGKHKKFVCT